MSADQTAEVEGLDRVLTRLALTEDEKLEQVLEKLLPIVIGKLNGAVPAVQKKILEILTHVNKRTKALPSLRLPLPQLLSLYTSPASGPLARNFALVYLESAAGRAQPQTLFAELDGIMRGVSERSPPHQEILLRVAGQALEHMAQQGNAFEFGKEGEFAARYGFLAAPADRRLLLSSALRLTLYQPPWVKSPASALQAAQQAQQAQPMDVDNAAGGVGPTPQGPLPPPGLSQADVAAVEGKQAPPAEALLRRKLGALNFSAAAGVDPSDALLLYLAASCDPNEQVSRRGEELLRKRCGVDSPKPAVDLESSQLVERLYRLYHGDWEDTSLPPRDRRTPASIPLRCRLLGLFTKSVAAANCFPFTLTTITECLYGSGTTPRLRQLGMEMAVWVFRHAEAAQLTPAAEAILGGCLDLLDHDSTRGLDTISLTLRGFTYQAVGQLAQRQPQAFAARTDIAERFFHALAAEPPGVRAAVQESISALGGAFRGCQGAELEAVRSLLMEAVRSPAEAVRMAALQWTLKLFPFQDVPARYMCMLAAADTRHTIIEAGLDGLKPDKFVAAAAAAGAAAVPGAVGGGGAAGAPPGVVLFPPLQAVLQYLVGKHPALGRAVEEGSALVLSPKAFVAAIDFMERCREEGGGLEAGKEGVYFTFLENGLVRSAPSELHAAALGAMLAVAGEHRNAFTAAFVTRTTLLLRMLGHVDRGTRGTAAKLLGMLSPTLGAAQIPPLVDTLQGLAWPEAGRKVRFEETEGAITALGFVAAQLSMDPPADLAADVVPSILRRLHQGLQVQDRQLASSAALALGHASLALVGDGSSGGGVPDPQDLIPVLAEMLQDKDPKVVRRVALALGYIAWGHASSAAVLAPAVEAVLGLRTSKAEEVLFAAGEALSFSFGGAVVTCRDILCTNFQTLGEWVRVRERKREREHQTGGGQEGAGGKAGEKRGREGEGEGSMDVDPPAGPSEEGGAPQEVREGGADGARTALQESQDKILESLLGEYVCSTRAEVRCAGAVWLVSLLLYGGGTSPRMRVRLPEIQDALSQLLGDSNELTQEMSSRGLTAVYNLADEGTRQALVDTLVGTLSGAPVKKRAVKVSGETQLFEKGQLGAVPGGGSLSTYKELCALATDLGQPDLVYRFMELANHQAAVNSSRGAAFGFASIARLAGEQLQPHLSRIIPRLYRYLYDPNGKVRDAMSHIWHALLDDPKRSVSDNFDAVAAALLRDLGSSQWRVREAAAGAMADLLQGRKWEQLRRHLEPIWSMTFRVMDDIKETVRQAGLALGRTVRGVSLRLADPELTPPQQGKEAISLTLPLLLEQGLPSQVPEIQALALDTSAKLVKGAGAELLRPHMPLLVPAMLESLSGLEDSRLSYAEQHLGGEDRGRLERLRVAAAQGGPVGETLDLCARYMDAKSLAELAPRLAALVRRGVGLATRAGAGRFISQVARRLGSDIQPSAPQLMKSLVEGCKGDRSGAVKRSFAAANACVARYAASPRVAKLVGDCLEMYGAEDADDNARLVAGLLLRELGKEAGDVFAQHAGALAPQAYLAQCDGSADVASMWQEVWEECATSAGAGLRVHVQEIAQLITCGLQSGQWGRKKGAALALDRACTAAPDAVQPLATALMESLLKELPGRLWDGKEAVLVAVGALATACPSQILGISSGNPAADSTDPTAPPGSLGSRVVAALVEAGGKVKSGYRLAALEQLERVLKASAKGGSGDGRDFFALASPLLLDLCSKYVVARAEGPEKMDVEGGKGSGAGEEAGAKLSGGGGIPIAQVCACLAAAWGTASLGTAGRHISEVGTSLADVLGAAARSSDQLAAAAAATRFAQHCGQLVWAGGAAAPGGEAATSPLLGADLATARRLLTQVLRLGAEGKASQLREHALQAAKALLQPPPGGGGLWGELGGEEREGLQRELAGLGERERVPALKALALGIAAGLEEKKNGGT